MSEFLEGGCTCGEVRYRLLAKPLFVHCCHCTTCQIESGSAFALNAMIEASNVETLKGGVVPNMVPTESGMGQQVWRCPNCLMALWSNFRGADDRLRFVRVGTLDDSGALPPDIHIYTRSKLPWVRLPEGALASEAYYDTKATWPAESLARRKALFG